MPEHPTWFVGDRNPVIEDTVTVEGVPVDISAKTVTFKMRAVGSATLKVNQPVTTKEADGDWTYGWGANDLDTAGTFLVWVTVDMGGGALQTVNEDTIVVAAHAIGTNTYLELEEAKSTLEIEAGHANNDLRIALTAASRVIDEITGTRFYSTAVDEVRYYSPDAAHLLFIDEANTVTELATDEAGGTAFATVWTVNTDYILEPLNATVGSTQIQPWHRVRAHPRSSKAFQPGLPRSVRITGKFGWAIPPEAVKAATSIIATKILRRARSAPMGIVTAFDGTAVRMSRFDPQLDELLAPYNRSTPYE